MGIYIEHFRNQYRNVAHSQPLRDVLCYRAIATLLSHRLQGILSRYSQCLLLAESAEYEDKLNDSILDGVAIAAKRFECMVGRLKVS
ncbi:MAG: hypothetical protein ACYTXA_06045 [Nostoc sp.]